MSDSFDVLIIGAGPGGVKAAKMLAKAGKKVALIEQHLVGGECLHYGCIPSKVFLHTSWLYEKLQKISQFGIEVENLVEAKQGLVRLNFSALMERKKKVVETLHRGLVNTLKQLGVEVVNGPGVVTDSHTVEVRRADTNIQTFRADFIIVAAGSEPASLPGFSTTNVPAISAAQKTRKSEQSPHILNNRTVFDLQELPKSLVIVGGGAVGCEFASFFAAFHVPVTVVERGERLLMNEDTEISAEFEKLLVRRGVKILKNISFSQQLLEESRPEYVLLGIGRKRNFDCIPVLKDIAHLSVNEFLQTSVPNIYAIGDFAGKAFLAYTAEMEGEIAARHILGEKISIDYSAIPNAIFTHPEIASVGIKSNEVPSAAETALIGKANFATNSKALIEGERDGFAKVIVDAKTRHILGVHVIGNNATLLIDKATLAVSEKLTVEQFLKALTPHPVVSEVLKEAFESLQPV